MSQFQATYTPTINVDRDYDSVFESRIRQAIALNKEHNIDMLPVIKMEAGPYRSYCMSYSRNTNQGIVELDFYSASRTFGFEHSIEDIAQAISTSFTRI